MSRNPNILLSTLSWASFGAMVLTGGVELASQIDQHVAAPHAIATEQANTDKLWAGEPVTITIPAGDKMFHAGDHDFNRRGPEHPDSTKAITHAVDIETAEEAPTLARIEADKIRERDWGYPFGGALVVWAGSLLFPRRPYRIDGK